MKTMYCVILLMILCSCTVTPDNITIAQSLCEPNGGLKYIGYSILKTGNVTCNNGSLFQNPLESYESNLTNEPTND